MQWRSLELVEMFSVFGAIIGRACEAQSDDGGERERGRKRDMEGGRGRESLCVERRRKRASMRSEQDAVAT